MTDGSVLQAKKCSKCGEVKGRGEFGPNKRAKSGLRSECRVCSRSYYKNNREKVREYRKGFREANRGKVREWSRKYREGNPDKIKETQRKYYEANRDKLLEYNRSKYKDNVDQERERSRKYHRNNPGKARAKSSRRRARERNATIGDLPEREELLAKQGGRCFWCARKEYQIPMHGLGYKWAIDHVDPLSGDNPRHTADNVVMSCWQCNNRKGAKSPQQWAEENGRLL